MQSLWTRKSLYSCCLQKYEEEIGSRAHLRCWSVLPAFPTCVLFPLMLYANPSAGAWQGGFWQISQPSKWRRGRILLINSLPAERSWSEWCLGWDGFVCCRNTPCFSCKLLTCGCRHLYEICQPQQLGADAWQWGSQEPCGHKNWFVSMETSRFQRVVGK